MKLAVALSALTGIFVLACSSPAPAPVEPTPNVDAKMEAKLAQEGGVDATVQAKTLSTTQASCKLTGGETVESGWTGEDTGNNSCNSCFCTDGALGCTKMACLPHQVSPDSRPVPTHLPTPKPKPTATRVRPTWTPVPLITPTPWPTATPALTPVPDPLSVHIHPTSCSSSEIGISKKWIETLESANFTKCVRPFGLLIGAQDGIPDVYIAQAAKIAAEILDPDMDGEPNDSTVFQLVSDYTTAWIPMPTDRNSWTSGGVEDELGQKLGSYGLQLPQWWMIGDKEFGDLNPDQKAVATMVEEIIHFMTQFGYSPAYPEIFGVESWNSLIAKETKRASCDWWQHPENDCPNNPRSYGDGCSHPNCDVTEFYHQVLVTRAGMKPGWLGIGFPTTPEELDLKLSSNVKEAMDLPKYNQINKPLVFSYPNRIVTVR